ncbi:acyl carrier protein [Streptomyces sp. G45]|uniref:acyl carrier protein n=1 Tax=Streptomyces sp. G45 TaxID=3406627 RepID=UPI003C23DCF5
MSTNSNALHIVTEHIAAIRPSLEPAAITPEASLTAELGMDSMDLVELSARITADYPDFDMNAWLLRASTPGMDHLGSLVAVLTTRPEADPEAREA